jgi:hypothetical protein
MFTSFKLPRLQFEGERRRANGQPPAVPACCEQTETKTTRTERER